MTMGVARRSTPEGNSSDCTFALDLQGYSVKNRFSVVPSVKMSEFDGNLVIQTVKCRIPQFKEGFGLIYRETRSLQRLKTKKRDNLSVISRYVTLTLPTSNSFYENVEELYSLKEMLIQQGILSHERYA
jgi:hypothetical protein